MIYDQIFLIFQILFASLLGLSVNLTYQKLGYEWAANKNQKIIALLLAPITLIITKTIAENLALSLGMIGALSIVRFRNPVKSPLELVVYFIYITIGISSGVNIYYSILLTSFVIIMPLVLRSKFFSSHNLLNDNNPNSVNYYFNIEIIKNDNDLFKEITNKINKYKLISKFFDSEKNILNYTILVSKQEAKEIADEIEKFRNNNIVYNMSIQNDGE